MPGIGKTGPLPQKYFIFAGIGVLHMQWAHGWQNVDIYIFMRLAKGTGECRTFPVLFTPLSQ